MDDWTIGRIDEMTIGRTTGRLDDWTMGRRDELMKG